MIQIFEEKTLKILRKHIIKSSLFILLLIAAFSFSFSFFYYQQEDLEWKCPSCPRKSLNSTKPPPQAPSPSPTPTPTALSHVVFAVAASSATWHRRSAYSQLWWDAARGHVWLDRDPDVAPSCSAACPPIRVSANNFSRFGERASASRIASIVADSYNLGLEDVRWFVMGDDDTVFFKENLLSVLNRYDHNEMYYVGAGSESVEQDEMHSYRMAFGGGGFAVTAPAARDLAAAMEGCLDRYRWFWGSDQRVYACLTELGVPLTTEPGFHQVDLRGDAYGMLAAHPITPLVSLHHLDSVAPISPLASTQLEAVQSLIQASKSDSARTLQQTFCYVLDQAFNWSVSVSWGYTVQIYPWVLPPDELGVPLQTFQTWRSFKDGPFVFNTRPFQLDQECKQPFRFFFHNVRVFDNGMVYTTVSEYVTYEEKKSKRCDLPGFVAASKVELVRVYARKMNPNVWQKAPRRQCCETRRIKRGKIMEVKIRGCYSGEITSPP